MVVSIMCLLFVFTTQFLQDEGAFYYSHLACLESVPHPSRPGFYLKTHPWPRKPGSRHSRCGATERPTFTDSQGLGHGATFQVGL